MMWMGLSFHELLGINIWVDKFIKLATEMNPFKSYELHN